jgi:hypothetical protein
MNREEIAWAAGLFEGEGCFSPRRPSGRNSMHLSAAREIESFEQLAEGLGHRDDRWAVQRNVNRHQMRFDHPLCVGCESQHG